MATYTPASRHITSSERSAQITLVSDGDQIDITDVLGRPAKRLQFIMTDPADTIDYKLNSLKKLHVRKLRTEFQNDAEAMWGTHGRSEVEIWSGATDFPTYQSTGSTVIETAEGLQISSVQIDGLSLSTGSTITIIAW